MFPIGDDNRDRLHRPVVTYLLIALNIAVFLFMLTLHGRDQNFFVYQGASSRHVSRTLPPSRLPTRRSPHRCI